MTAKEVLLRLSVAHKGNWDEMYGAILRKEEAPLVDTSKESDFFTLTDDVYPDGLKHAYNPPILLYYKGNINLLRDKHIISVIGSREPSKEFFYNVENYFKSFDTTITGGAKGSDEYIISRSARPIVVLACGLDKAGSIVDKIVAAGGLVITEYPMGVDMEPNTCMIRNRIVEGIATQTLVLESRKCSSTSTRIEFALAKGNDIFAVPYSLSLGDDFENNDLICNGCIVATSLKTLNEWRA